MRKRGTTLQRHVTFRRFERRMKGGMTAPQTSRASIAVAGFCGHRPCLRDHRLGAQLFLRSDPVLDVLPSILAALDIKLVSSLSNFFPRYFFVFDHCCLLDRRHGAASAPCARYASTTLR